MKQQSFATHRRLVPAFHFYTLALVVFILIGSVIYFFQTLNQGGIAWLQSLIMVAISVVLASFFIFMRLFALRAQDRAIRAEENLRHLALTGRLLDPSLTISQVIALRFAPDEELIELASMAAEKNMSPTEIKKAIREWKADLHRV